MKWMMMMMNDDTAGIKQHLAGFFRLLATLLSLLSSSPFHSSRGRSEDVLCCIVLCVRGAVRVSE